MEKYNWNKEYVTITTVLFFGWLLTCVILLIFKTELFGLFVAGTVIGWLAAVSTSRATNTKL